MLSGTCSWNPIFSVSSVAEPAAAVVSTRVRPVPVHLMVSCLDLGKYVGKTPEPDTSFDRRVIFAPCFQAAVAVPGLSRPFKLALVSYLLTYAPQYVQGESSSTSTGVRASRRHGLFVNYYAPLWDFN